MQDILFTGGKKTLGNAGHSNALWTFLMPFSRFFSHYSGQIYKLDETLPPNPDDGALRRVFRRVPRWMCRSSRLIKYFGLREEQPFPLC